MSVLSRSTRNAQMVSLQCDVCCPPLIATNTIQELRRSGWRMAREGEEFDACPPCTRERMWRRVPLRRDRGGAVCGEGRLPNLVVFGAAKCGTTSLHAYLDSHPEIAMAQLKELRFFQDPGCGDWERWYRGQFSLSEPIVGESSTMYSRRPALPGTAQRMAALIPDTQLIYMVRDPVERAIASYLEERFQLLDQRPVEAAFADLEDPYNPYVAASRYGEQLDEYLKYFSREQILVVPLSDLQSAPDETMGGVFRFLGVDETHATDTGRRLNEGSAKYEYGALAGRLRSSALGRLARRSPQGPRVAIQVAARRLLSRPLERPEVSPALRERLEGVLASDAARFRQLSGLSVADWSV